MQKGLKYVVMCERCSLKYLIIIINYENSSLISIHPSQQAHPELVASLSHTETHNHSPHIHTLNCGRVGAYLASLLPLLDVR